jgi:hypothetical protein
MAQTNQNGGFGSASIITSVYLKWTNAAFNARARKPIEVLEFFCYGPARRPYVLDKANAGGTINLKMNWITPSHLLVTYDGKADIDLQVIKVAGIDISLRNLSKETTNSSP